MQILWGKTWSSWTSVEIAKYVCDLFFLNKGFTKSKWWIWKFCWYVEFTHYFKISVWRNWKYEKRENWHLFWKILLYLSAGLMIKLLRGWMILLGHYSCNYLFSMYSIKWIFWWVRFSYHLTFYNWVILTKDIDCNYSWSEEKLKVLQKFVKFAKYTMIYNDRAILYQWQQIQT